MAIVHDRNEHGTIPKPSLVRNVRGVVADGVGAHTSALLTLDTGKLQLLFAADVKLLLDACKRFLGNGGSIAESTDPVALAGDPSCALLPGRAARG